MESPLSMTLRWLLSLKNILRLLRAFKPLFDASLEELSKNESIGESIPISMVIQLIISRSPKDLKSPFQVADWTPRTRYQPTHITYSSLRLSTYT